MAWVHKAVRRGCTHSSCLFKKILADNLDKVKKDYRSEKEKILMMLCRSSVPYS